MKTLQQEMGEQRKRAAEIHQTTVHEIMYMTDAQLLDANRDLSEMCYGRTPGGLWRGHVAWNLLWAVNYELGWRGMA